MFIRAHPWLNHAVLPHKQIESRLQRSRPRLVLPDADVSTVPVRPCDPSLAITSPTP